MSTNCPICSNTNVFLKHNKNKYNYYFCLKCRVLYLDPIPPKNNLNKYYKKNFTYNTTHINSERMLINADKIISKLISLNPDGKTLLDIGPGYGYLMKKAKKHNLIYKGVEISDNLYKELIQKNADVYHGTIDNFLNINQNMYDFITIIHTLEHLTNPKKIINTLATVLNKKGIIYIETPNLNSHLYQKEGINYTYLTPPEHIFIFSERTIRNIISFKYQSINIYSYSYPEHFMGILKSILRKKNGVFSKITNIYKPESSKIKRIKHILFDLIVSKSFCQLLNFNKKGSILEVYIKI